jgi:hypothetical protein
MREDTTGPTGRAGAGAGAGRERSDLREAVVRALSRSPERDSGVDLGPDGAIVPPSGVVAEAEARLRRAVVEYTRAMRGSGLRPERVLVLLKQVLREAGTGVEPPRRRALTERATNWCITAYFEDADAEPPTASSADGASGP